MTQVIPLPLSPLPTRREMKLAFDRRDPDYDGVFFVAVRTTGIFCRPSCPSRPDPRNVEFLHRIRDCLVAGYRPCKRCRPTDIAGPPPHWVNHLLQQIQTHPDRPPKSDDLRALGITPERARRWFQQHYGMSFAAWCRTHRLTGAFDRIRRGASLDDAGFDAGFESASGFREAFERTFGTSPGRARQSESALAERVVLEWIESPLGPLLAGTRDAGLCLLEFSDPRLLGRTLETLGRRFGAPLLPGEHPLLDRLRSELSLYFAGRLREFTLPLAPHGTPFQNQVWTALGRIPYARTMSYETLAERVGRPTGQRAVARANGDNRLCILIPCHRVIGKNGELTGYGGGLWRKRLLLELERTGHLPD